MLGHRTVLALLLLSVSTMACTSAPDDAGGSDDHGAFTGGKPTNGNPEVGRLALLEDGANGASTEMACTGTLVAPNVVLTSGSCDLGAFLKKEGQFIVDADVPLRFPIESGVKTGEKVGSAYWLVRLTTSVPSDVARPATLRTTTLVDGEKLVAIGYGTNASSAFGEKNTKPLTFDATSHPPERAMNAADTGCAVFDAQAKLAAMGASPASGELYVYPDAYAQIGESYAELADAIARLSAE